MLFSEVAAFGVAILENRCQLLGEYALIPIYNGNVAVQIRL